MSGITIQVPITCPRVDCPGVCYAHIGREIDDRPRYKVVRVEGACSQDHVLTDKEWDDAAREAKEIARVWTQYSKSVHV